MSRILWVPIVGAASPYFSLYVLALGGTAQGIGIIAALRPFANVLTYPIAGYLADYQSRVKLISLGSYLQLLPFVCFVFAPHWLLLAAGYFLLGFVVFHIPVIATIIADSLPSHRRGMGFAITTALPGAATILSPYIGGFIITKYGLDPGMRYIYAASVLVGFLIAIIRSKFLIDTITAKSSGSRLSLSIVKDAYASIFETLRWMPRNLKYLTLVLTLSFCSNALVAPFWIVYGVNQIQLPVMEWSLIILLSNGLMWALSVPAGVMIDKIGERKLIITALMFSILPVFLFTYCTTFLSVLAVFCLISIANAFLTPACSAFMARIVPTERRGRVMSALGQGSIFISASAANYFGAGPGFLSAIPVTFGSVIGGYVFSFNPTYPWVILSATLLLNSLLMILFVKSPPEN